MKFVLCETVLIYCLRKINKKKEIGEENPDIKIWLELPISFSSKFLENLTELYNFFLGQKNHKS